MRDARPRRSHKRFLIRQKKEKRGQKIQKRDSDYYWLRDMKRKKAPAFIPGGEDLTPASSSANTPVDTDRDVQERQRFKERGERDGSAALSVTFGSNKGTGKAKTKLTEKEIKEKEEKAKQLESLFSDEEVVIVRDSKKRKSPQATVEPPSSTSMSRSTSATNYDRLSPSKKQRSPPPRSTPQPPKQVTTIKQTSTNASQPSSSSTTSSPVPAVQPPPPDTIIKQTPTNASQPAPSSTRPSPSPEVKTKKSEPLFLDDAPSPVESFQPIPGIFDHQDDPVKTKPEARTPSPSPAPRQAPSRVLSPPISKVAPITQSSVTEVKRSSPPPAAIVSISADSAAPVAKSTTTASSAAAHQTQQTPTSAVAATPVQPSSSTVLTVPPPTHPVVRLPPLPTSATLDAPMSAVQITPVDPPVPSTLATPVSSTTEAPPHQGEGRGSPESEAMDIDDEEDVPSAPPVASPSAHATTTDVMIPSPTRESPLHHSPESHIALSPAHAISPISPPRFGSDDAPPKAQSQANTTSSQPMSPPRPPHVPTPIRPPRFGFGDAPKPAPKQVDTTLSKPTSPTTAKSELSSPVKPTIPLAERPKYVQPSRVKVMDAIVDPEALARREKLAQKQAASQNRKGSGSGSTAGSSLQAARTAPSTRPSNAVPPPHGPANGLGQRPAAPAGPQRPPFHHPDRPIPGSSHIPTQPKGRGGAPPTGPSSTIRARPPAGYGNAGSGPFADQYGSFSPHLQRQPGGGMTPGWLVFLDTSVIWISLTANRGGGSPLVHTDRW